MKKEVAKAIYKASHITGEFKLRSGQMSKEYFDKYLFEADPKLLEEIATLMKENIPLGTEVIAGLEMGAIPIATILSSLTNIPTAFVRKKAKEYGTCKLVEGASVSNKKVCVIEDVVSTGGAIIEMVAEMRKLDAVIDTVLCAVLRDEKAITVLAEHGLKLVPLFTMDFIKAIQCI